MLCVNVCVLFEIEILPQFYENTTLSASEEAGLAESIPSHISNQMYIQDCFFPLVMNFILTTRFNTVIWWPLSQRGPLHASS